MPKLKTRKAVKKRFKITATGKVLRPRTKRRHLLTDRPKGLKRRFKRYTLIDTTDADRVKKTLPYA